MINLLNLKKLNNSLMTFYMSSENSLNFYGSSTTTSYPLDPFIINYDIIMALMTGKAKIIYTPIFNSDGFLIKNYCNTIEYNFDTDPSFDNLNIKDILSLLPTQPSKEFIQKTKKLIKRYCQICKFSINEKSFDFEYTYDNYDLINNTIIYYDSLNDKMCKKDGRIAFLMDIIKDKSFIVSNNNKSCIETKLISPYIPVYQDFSNPEMYFNNSLIDQHIISELAIFCNLI